MVVLEHEVAKLKKDQVRKTLKRKSGKAVSPEKIPVAIWKS